MIHGRIMAQERRDIFDRAPVARRRRACVPFGFVDRDANAVSPANRVTGTLHGLKAIATIAILASGGCAAPYVAARLPGSSSEFRLSAPLAEAFRQLAAHDAQAITLSDRLTIYGTAAPPSDVLRCHEGEHRKQAREIGNALVAIDAIEDTDQGRQAAWLAVYGQAYVRHGYDNTFERRARAPCEEQRR
jgi:hypothetical protein